MNFRISKIKKLFNLHSDDLLILALVLFMFLVVFSINPQKEVNYSSAYAFRYESIEKFSSVDSEPKCGDDYHDTCAYTPLHATNVMVTFYYNGKEHTVEKGYFEYIRLIEYNLNLCVGYLKNKVGFEIRLQSTLNKNIEHQKSMLEKCKIRLEREN